MRRVALAVAALVGASTLPTAAPSVAAGSCTITTPSKVTINREYREYPVSFAGACVNKGGMGSWQAVHPTKGSQEWFYVSGGSSTNGARQTFDVYDWMLPVGTYKVRPDYAYDSKFNELTQNTRTMTVKLGSRNVLTSSRSGSKVTLSSKVSTYNTTYNQFRNRGGATVKFYVKNANGTWSYKGTAKSGSTGVARLTVTSSTKRIYKAVTSAGSTYWGATSATATR